MCDGETWEDDMSFSLNAALKAANTSKRRLSKATGIPYAMVIRLSKAGANPTWSTVCKIARALNCSLDQFTPRRRRKGAGNAGSLSTVSGNDVVQ